MCDPRHPTFLKRLKYFNAFVELIRDLFSSQ